MIPVVDDVQDIVLLLLHALADIDMAAARLDEILPGNHQLGLLRGAEALRDISVLLEQLCRRFRGEPAGPV